jgi:hypothetical protein
VRHLDAAELNAGLDHVLCSPRDGGEVRMLVRRPTPRERELLTEASLDLVDGLVGDNWRTRGSRHTVDGSADPDAQITIMNIRVAELVAGPEPGSAAMAGDQLYVDLDLSIDNLPPGTLLSIGDCVLEVSAKPHTGCAKFVERFGAEAMRFVNSPIGRPLRLRGMNARVVVPGTLRVGDRVGVTQRAEAALPVE